MGKLTCSIQWKFLRGILHSMEYTMNLLTRKNTFLAETSL